MREQQQPNALLGIVAVPETCFYTQFVALASLKLRVPNRTAPQTRPAASLSPLCTFKRPVKGTTWHRYFIVSCSTASAKLCCRLQKTASCPVLFTCLHSCVLSRVPPAWSVAAPARKSQLLIAKVASAAPVAPRFQLEAL